MRKPLTLFAVVVGVAVAGWGVQLIHESFTDALALEFLVKSGGQEIHTSVRADHSREAWKQVVVQVGHVIFGTSIVAAVLSRGGRRP